MLLLTLGDYKLLLVIIIIIIIIKTVLKRNVWKYEV